MSTAKANILDRKERDRLRRQEAWDRQKAEDAAIQQGIGETIKLEQGRALAELEGRVRAAGIVEALSWDYVPAYRQRLTLEAASAVADTTKGRVRLKSRDGLHSLFISGAIGEPEYGAGLRYRKAFETMNAGPRSNLNRDITGGGEHFGTVRAERALDLAEWESLASTDRQRWILRLVAGQGATITSVSAGKSTERLRNAEALQLVLRQIAIREKLCRAA